MNVLSYEVICFDSLMKSSNFVLFFIASTDILLDMVGKLHNPKVALVHQMPFTTDQPGLAAAVEKVGTVTVVFKSMYR